MMYWYKTVKGGGVLALVDTSFNYLTNHFLGWRCANLVGLSSKVSDNSSRLYPYLICAVGVVKAEGS
jgi:hypothetical protein